MRYIPNQNHDPALNLAMEEYILCSSGIQDPVLFFYINDPSVIIGRHQNTMDEIRREFVDAHHIRVVRRLSGGGAVYHDHGTLNFSFIQPGCTAASGDFKVFTAPIIQALHTLGADVTLSGRNDLVLNGFKISGNAYYHNAWGCVCHGTLLFDTDLSVLSQALQPRPEKMLARGIQSVRSRVCNLRPFLPGIVDTEALKGAILSFLCQQDQEFQQQEFTVADRGKFTALARQRYCTDEWNYGKSPAYTLRKTVHKNFGWMDIRLDIREGSIHDLRLLGDFFCDGETAEIEKELCGSLWQADVLRENLKKTKWESCFPTFPPEEFIDLLFS